MKNIILLLHVNKIFIRGELCYASLLQDHPDLVGIPIVPRIEQKVGLIWRKGKYTASSTEAFISFVKDYPLFPEEP